MKTGKLKRRLCLLLLALAAGLAVPAGAEGAPAVRELLAGMGQLTPVPQTPYLLAQQLKQTDWGVYNTDGEELIPCQYASLTYLAYNCFDAGKFAASSRKANSPLPTLDEVNSHTLVTADGTQISDFQYGLVKAVSPYWACGWVLAYGSKENSDCKIDGDYYICQRCDLYYLGDHALLGVRGEESLPPCLSLTREEYKTAAGHGKYLYVQDRQNAIRVYDAALEPLDLEITAMKDPMYVIRNWAVAVRGSTELLIDGCAAVDEVITDAGLLLKVTRLDYSGAKCTGVYTPEGEELMPVTKGTAGTVTRDYAVLTVNKKKGLYSFREKRLLVPCEYDEIPACKTALDPYVLHGYIAVKEGTEQFWVEAATGDVISAPKLDKQWAKTGGAYTMIDGKTGDLRLLPPSQEEYRVGDTTLVEENCRGSGYLLSAKSIYKHMLVTWRGEVLLKFYEHPFVVTDDDRAVVETLRDGYKLLEIVTE